MSLSDYVRPEPNDNFELEDEGHVVLLNGFGFPCSKCRHRFKTDKEEPCRTCGHNVNAVKK